MATGPAAGDRTGTDDQTTGRHRPSAEPPTPVDSATHAPRPVRRALVAAAYREEVARAGGVWRSCISVADPHGPSRVAVHHGADELVEAYSVNKIAVAVAVLEKIDRGMLRLGQPVRVTEAALVDGGEGIFALDGTYPSSVTLGHVLAALLAVSDDTAVRLCGLVCPARELNGILAAKGFPHTRVEPVDDPNRFYLGTTTARETHDLLRALVRGSLLRPASTAFLLAALRSPIAFTDGVRRGLSEAERRRVATKAGWFATARGEAGVIFDRAGAAALTYAMFADIAGADPDGAARAGGEPTSGGPIGGEPAGVRDGSHPAVRARAAMGRRFVDGLAGPGTGPAG